MAKVSKGDRVRLTVDAFVYDKNDAGFGVDVNDTSLWFPLPLPADVTIEKTDPPVVTFKPGDVLKSRMNSNIIITLNDNGGYTYVGSINHGLTAAPGGFWDLANSKHFEKVDLG